MQKRTFLKLSASFLATGWSASLLSACGSSKKAADTGTQMTGKPMVPAPVFELPPLPYSYSALEPLIDAKTMEIHHGKHHAAYVKNLNTALQGTQVPGTSIESILKAVTAEQAAVRNNGGGHFNHSLYWKVMQPGGKNKPDSLEIGKAIATQFGSYEAFAEKFTKSASTLFGSGWVWLSIGQDKKLFISTTPNQDNPLMHQLVKETGTPVLGIDIWEHAYYLKHQNKRADYIANFMQLINWDVVDGFYRAG